MYIALLLVLLVTGFLLALVGRRRKSRSLVFGGVGLALATLVFYGLMSFWGEMLWFEEVGFLRRFWIRIIAEAVVILAGATIAAALVWLATLPLRAHAAARWSGTIAGAFIGTLWGMATYNVALRFVYSVSTGQVDPIFGMDTGFYLFKLPFYDALFWLLLAPPVLALLVAASVVAASSETDEHEIVAPRNRQPLPERAWFVPIGMLALVLAFGRILAPYHIMYSSAGIVYGAGWTDVHIRLPVHYVLAALLVVMAIVLLVPAVTQKFARSLSKRFGASAAARAKTLVSIPAIVVAAIWFLGLGVLPALVQWLVVEPNEIALERPYIEHNIAFTRDGFHLADVDIREFPIEAKMTPDVVRENEALLSEVRLWDPHAFNDVAQQFQELRLYYEITAADFDRYRFGGAYRQVMFAPREMEVGNLPVESQTFVNRHFKYTHGYGLIMAPVSDFSATGLPLFIVRDLPPVGEFPSLRIERPEIYYGELTNDYVIANSRAPEFDYPQGGTNVYNHYAGKGGVPLENFWRKLVYGWTLGGTRLLFSDYPRAESRVMFHRNIAERLDKVAPFLTLDYDPYAVVVDGRIQWIVDAYTTSTRYPYSEPFGGAPAADVTSIMRDREVQGVARMRASERLRGVNYVRNSVKAVIDAYDGTITLYVFDPSDAIVQVWSRIYPDLFKPMDAMPSDLRAHVRYPEAMLATQGLVFAKYHMTDPVVFYNQEDLWIHATEKYYDEIRPVEPYYVMWQAPNSSDLEFILMQPYTPKSRQVLIGWIAGLCDGDNYGKMVAYRFPKDKWVLGPQQVDTKIDQSPDLSSQLTLWDQHGKRVIRGNVLAIPVGETLLYVEPIYIQAQTAAYPELRIVVVMHGEDMSYAPTFAQALEGLVAGKPSAAMAFGDGATFSQAAQEANEAFEEYVRLLRTGEFAEAGKQLERLREALRGLADGEAVPSN